MAEETDAQGVSRLAHIVGKFVAPVSAITALMVYFGWAFTTTTYRTFGIDDSVLGFSIQDYLFRSVNETFKPAVLLLLMTLVAVPTHLGLIKVVGRRGRPRRIVFLTLGVVGLTSTVVGLLGFLGVVTYRVVWPLVPMSLGLGVLLVGYVTLLWRAVTGAHLQPLGDSNVIDLIARVSLAGFLTVTLLWSVVTYARIDGAAYALQLAQRITSLPGVVVFAPHPLHLDTKGVRETVLIGDQGSRYYRYAGLRLLVRASDRYILLPPSWQPGTRTIVLRDDPAVRFEFYLGDG